MKISNISKFYNEYLAVVGGADALGTLSPSDFALAEYASISEAGVYYAADSSATTEQVINRLRAIILQIDAQPNAKAAWELNTYAKAEIGRIAPDAKTTSLVTMEDLETFAKENA